MDVIGVAVEMKTIFMDNLANGQDVYKEEKGTKYRTLRDNKSDREGGWSMRA